MNQSINPVNRVVVANKIGCCGKTTLVRHLLMPLFPNAELIRIESETLSGGSIADLEVTGNQFELVWRNLLTADHNIIVDIGASNIAQVRTVMQRMGDAHEEIDLWFIPCPAGSDRMTDDTLAFVAELLAMGVEPSKICVVKNRVTDASTMDVDFADIAVFAKKTGITLIAAPVLESNLYTMLDRVRDLTIDQIADDKTDHKGVWRQLKTAGDDVGAAEALDREVMRKYAKSTRTNLVQVREGVIEVLVKSQATA